MPGGIPDYRLLEASGEALAAAEQMEDRAREPASEAMFEMLTRPLLHDGVRRVLEVGCGSGALAARIAGALPGAEILATDKSPTMLGVAARLRETEGVSNVTFAEWDVTDAASFPGVTGFDFIVSSVMLPYLSDEETRALVSLLASWLNPGGVLSFVEQDLQTLAIALEEADLVWKNKGLVPGAARKQTAVLNLRPLVRAAGLEVLPRASFLWTDDAMGPYMARLQQRTADDMVAAGVFAEEEGRRWVAAMEAKVSAGDFYYGLVYHRIAGRRE